MSDAPVPATATGGPGPEPDARLVAHLRAWLGRWPADGPGLEVVGWAGRERPGWDGAVHAVVGVRGPGSGVLSVPPPAVTAVTAAVAAGDLDGVPAAAGVRGRRFFIGVFRWTTAPAPLPDAGTWVPADAPGLPTWLRPFGGEVLVARDDDGRHLAGVGIKRHDAHGGELAVVTTEAARGRGLARALVAQAARRVLDEGAVPTYVHAHANLASARVAEATGFSDLGWTVLGLSETRSP